MVGVLGRVGREDGMCKKGLHPGARVEISCLKRDEDGT